MITRSSSIQRSVFVQRVGEAISADAFNQARSILANAGSDAARKTRATPSTGARNLPAPTRMRSSKGARVVRRPVTGRLGKVTRVLMIVGFLLGMLGISFNPGLRGRMMGWGADAFQSVRRIAAHEFERVAPVGAVASSEAAGHPHLDAINDTNNRWWAEGAEGNGEGERLVIEFSEPVDIAVVGVTPGAAQPEQFGAHPRLLHLVFINGATRTSGSRTSTSSRRSRSRGPPA